MNGWMDGAWSRACIKKTSLIAFHMYKRDNKKSDNKDNSESF
jgi:hypothetical protein